MKCTKMNIDGAYLIDIEPVKDKRGYFARTFCESEFEDHGIDMHVSQTNLSFNLQKGTLRGMHYQEEPYEESKVVSCVSGIIYDVVLDLRRESPTYLDHQGVFLSDINRRSVYIPKGCAHGYQTLVMNTVVMYMVSVPYSAKHSRIVSYKNYGIPWPLPVSAISDKDACA